MQADQCDNHTYAIGQVVYKLYLLSIFLFYLQRLLGGTNLPSGV